MKQELHSAANFIVHLLRLAKRGVSEAKLLKFQKSLIHEMRNRYRDHWFPEKPLKGSGYRTIRVNSKLDPMIGRAGKACNLSETFLLEAFPIFMLWINPLEVSYRFGENNPIYIFYDKHCLDPWTHQNPPRTSYIAPSSPPPKENNVNLDDIINDLKT
jgi:protein Tob/BTG